ncbi:macro domain-containing protein [Thermodesulfobacteriota bacterium]
MNEISLTFSHGKEFKIGIRDLLGAPVDVIVNPANSGLSHGAGVARLISEAAGSALEDDCERIMKKIGRVPETMAVPTRAGNLPFKGVIHAVGPRMGDGDELIKLEKTITHCLMLANKKGWRSIAFPAISTGIFGIPKNICAEAFKNAVPSFWETHTDSSVHLVWLCLLIDDSAEFEEVLQVPV